MYTRIRRNLRVVLCGTMLALIGICELYGQTVDPSLKLHFNFDQDFSSGQVLDHSGNGNHGWQFNPTNWITVTNGVFGSASSHFTYVGYMSNDPPHVYRLSQYIGVTNLNGISVLTNGTISFWAKFDPNGDLGMRVLDNGYTPGFTPNPSQSSNSWSLGRVSSPYLRFIVYSSSGARSVVNWPVDVVRWGGPNPDLSTTKFHLYTVTFDCINNRAVAYHDGQPCSTNSIDLPWLRIYGGINRRWLCIGAMSHAGTPEWDDDRYPNSGYFVGQLDDVRIYDRALSDAEVGGLYHGIGTMAISHSVELAPLNSATLQLSWLSQSNALYQVEYRTNLTLGNWVALLPPVLGTGTNNVTDSVSGLSMKYYRVRPLP